MIEVAHSQGYIVFVLGFTKGELSCAGEGVAVQGGCASPPPMWNVEAKMFQMEDFHHFTGSKCIVIIGENKVNKGWGFTPQTFLCVEASTQLTHSFHRSFFALNATPLS